MERIKERGKKEEEEGCRGRGVEKKRRERKSFDVFPSAERASGRMVDPKAGLST